jgi:hypothetical protein
VIRLTARGPVAVVAVALLALGVRHALVDTLEPEEAVSIIRAAQAREVSEQYLPLVKSADGTLNRDVARDYADALQAVQRERFSNVRVKRTWIPPIMVRQPAYYVTITREKAGEAEYYRVRGPFARQTSRLAWLFPIL